MTSSTAVLKRVDVHLDDEAATDRLGRALAPGLTGRLHLHLHGELGAGKTSLVRVLLRGLGHEGRVRSPTYAIVETYTVSLSSARSSTKSSLYFQHFDFYRFDRSSDWVDAGLRDVLASDAICAIEWPKRAEGVLPNADIDVYLSYSDTGRDARLEARTSAGARCLEAIDLPRA